MLESMQASGDNLLKVVPAFCDRLAHDSSATAPVSRKNKPSVYFDFLAFHMVRKSLHVPNPIDHAAVSKNRAPTRLGVWTSLGVAHACAAKNARYVQRVAQV